MSSSNIKNLKAAETASRGYSGASRIEGYAEKWGGLQPVLCSRLRQFAWDHDYSRAGITSGLKALFDSLNIGGQAYHLDFQGYFEYECPNRNCELEKVYLPKVVCGEYNPYNSWRHSSRCLDRILQRIEFFEKNTKVDYAIGIDLTCPGWVSAGLMDRSTLERLRKAVNRFLTFLSAELFRDRRSQLGGFYTVHVWKTHRPLEKHLHVHMLILNVAYNRKEKTFHRFRPRIDHVAIKRAWRAALRELGMWDAPDPLLPDCYVRYIKLSRRESLSHRIRYMFRKPVVDLNTQLSAYEVGLGVFDRAFARMLLRYTPRQVPVGFMRNLKRLGFVSSKSFSQRCPVCGGILVKIGFVPGNMPDIVHRILMPVGWLEVKPPPAGSKLLKRKTSKGN